MNITAFDLAQRFVGVKEVSGTLDNPQIMAMLQLDNTWPQHDEVPWCSAFVNYICWLLRLPRSKNLTAQSWLSVGQAIAGKDLKVGYDVAILNRPEASAEAGHVGFYAGLDDYSANAKLIYLLGGNQSNSVNVLSFPTSRILGLRRLYND
jgi:uncharacterized protein (TIGR02594 family)